MDRSYWTTQLVGLLIRTLILFFFLNSLRGLLNQVSEKNRAMRPDLVWLNLIPYFDYVWILITLIKVRASLRAEYASRGRQSTRGDAAFTVGLVSWILYVVTFAMMWLVWLSPYVLVRVVGLISLVMLGFWIAYWAKSSSLKGDLVPFAGLGAPAPLALGGACPSCGTAVGLSDDFCRSCGSRTATSAPVEGAEATRPAEDVGADGATCPFCGGTYRPNAQFCSVCGRPVA